MSHVDPLPSLTVPSRPRISDTQLLKLLNAAAGTDATAPEQLQDTLEALPPTIAAKGADQFGTALHWAVARGNGACLEILLEHLGRDIVNVKNRLGNSALHVACHLGQLGAVNALLNAGADATMQSQLGMTPLHHAVISSEVCIAAALLSHGAAVSQPFDASRPKATHAPAIAARVSASATGVVKQQMARMMLALLDKEEKLHMGWARACRALACGEMRHGRAREIVGSACSRM